LTIGLGTGCAGIGASGISGGTSVRAQFDPRLDFPVTRVAKATSGPEDGSEPAPRPEGPEPAADYAERDARLDKVSPALFWTGMVVGLVGSAAAIAFMVDGRVTESKVENGYDDGFTRAERDRLEDRGDLDNTLSKVSAGVGVAGFSLALIMAGIDYSRCGPVTKRRKCERLSAK
jgi:hypothetical protein